MKKKKIGEISRLAHLKRKDKPKFRKRKIASIGESLNTDESVSNFPVKDRKLLPHYETRPIKKRVSML